MKIPWMGVNDGNRWQSDRGSAIVEFSLITFTFIIVLLGVVEMGRMVLVYTTVANSARAGARYAIVHGEDRPLTGVGALDQASGPGTPCACPQIQTVVKNFASAGLVDPSLLVIVVSYPNGSNSAGSPVSVTVSYPYDPLVRFFNSLLSDTLSSTSQGIITF